MIGPNEQATTMQQLEAIWEEMGWAPSLVKARSVSAAQARYIDLTEERIRELRRAGESVDVASNLFQKLEEGFFDLATRHEQIASEVADSLSADPLSSIRNFTVARLALIRAAKRFVPERGIPFSIYARWWALAEVKRVMGR